MSKVQQRILIVDDEPNLRHMLRLMLGKAGYQVDEAADGSEALQRAKDGEYAFILCDLKMPVMDGSRFLDQAVAAGIGATIIMMSAYGSIDDALECLKRGAYDFVAKPFKKDEIILVLKKAEERERLKRENRRLRSEMARNDEFAGMVSHTPRMEEIFALIRRVADVKSTVLILGESGTGKELVARAIHRLGSRATQTFVAVNCGAIPENLLESELFGHLRGAFTDARSDRAGLFEQADGGTLFLDEIGEMPLSLQTKLLRVLQEGEIRPLGGTQSRKVDVRVIAATSRDLKRDVAEGKFREDLFYRLEVFTIELPPLRERIDDIPLLVEHFLVKHGERLGRPGIRCSAAALKILLAHGWPGNIRELENAIERGVILCDDDLLEPSALPSQLGGEGGEITYSPQLPAGNFSIKQAEVELEKELIRRALEKTGGNRTHAARLLEISPRALLYKLKEYGIE